MNNKTKIDKLEETYTPKQIDFFEKYENIITQFLQDISYESTLNDIRGYISSFSMDVRTKVK